VLAAVVAAALVTVLLAGAVLAGANSRSRVAADGQGMMPEVVVTAEMPRLLIPVVEVVAFRTVAMTGSDLHVN
jgi:hypothetical protein